MKKAIIVGVIVIFIASVIFEFWLMATYANTPVSEIPLCALLFLFNK